jgi:hypothetical protein
LLTGVVPVLGWIVGVVAAAAGLGAAASAVWGSRHRAVPAASA